MSTVYWGGSAEFLTDVTVTAFGVQVRVRVGGSGAESLRDHLLEAWDWCGAETSAVRDDGSPVVVAVLDPDEALHDQIWALRGVAGESLQIVAEALAPAITFAALEESRGGLLMLHAAGLAHPSTGRTALLVGASGAGKSTACRALGRQFAYVSDETIALTPDLEILDYPKPLSLFPEGRRWGKEQRGPSQLGLLARTTAVSVGAVVILTRDEAAPSPPEVTDLSVVDAVALMAEQSSYLGELSDPLHCLARVANSAGALVRVRYRDATELAPLLEEFLTRRTIDLGADEVTPPNIDDLASDSIGWGRTVARRPVLDFFSQDGLGVAMLADGRVLSLSPLATRLMTLLDGASSTVPELTDALVEEFGAPSDEPEPVRLVDDLVATLIGDGLLEHVED